MAMRLTIDSTPEKDLLYIRLDGEFSLSEANKTLLKMFQAVADNNIFKVLVDCRNLKGNPTALERFEHSKFAAEKAHSALKSQNTRMASFAYVGYPPLFDPNRFGETVAVNRGLDTMTSNNVEDALRWLKIEPSRAEEYTAKIIK